MSQLCVNTAVHWQKLFGQWWFRLGICSDKWQVTSDVPVLVRARSANWQYWKAIADAEADTGSATLYISPGKIIHLDLMDTHSFSQYRGTIQKLLSWFFSVKGVPHPLPYSLKGKSFFQKNLSGNGWYPPPLAPNPLNGKSFCQKSLSRNRGYPPPMLYVPLKHISVILDILSHILLTKR